jgi:hypothetical protein
VCKTRKRKKHTRHFRILKNNSKKERNTSVIFAPFYHRWPSQYPRTGHPQKQFKKRKKHKRHFHALVTEGLAATKEPGILKKTIQKEKKRTCHFHAHITEGLATINELCILLGHLIPFISCLSFHHSRLSTTTPVKNKLIKYQKTGYLVLVAHAKSSGEDV